MAGTLMGATQNEKAMLFRSLQRIWAEATSHGFGITNVLGPSWHFTWKNVLRADNARIKFRLRQATIAKQYSLAIRTKSARPNKV